jgi:hypothetical protein
MGGRLAAAMIAMRRMSTKAVQYVEIIDKNCSDKRSGR